MDKLRNVLKVNKKVFVFLLCILILGVLFGSILPIFLDPNDKKLVNEYLSSFVLDIKGEFDFLIFLKNGLLSEGLFFLIIWLLGISIIGVPIVLFLFFYKCFVIGFSISSIIINYGFKGILFSLSYIFPHYAFSIFSYIILTSYSLIFSIKLLLFILKKTEFNIRVSFKKYLYVFLFCFLIVIFCILYEAFVNPYVLRFVFKLLGI